MQKVRHTRRLLRALLLASVLSGCVLTDDGSPQAVLYRGLVDSGGRTDTIVLDGAWAFWPNQFIYPNISPDNYDRFAHFPESWTSYVPESYPAYGYGSYAVTIAGLNPALEYAFSFPGYSCAARYFVNGREFYTQGVPGNNRKSERPDWKTAVVPLPDTNSRTVTLVLHLSNFNDMYPASSLPIKFGTYDRLNVMRYRDRLSHIFPFGAILAMGAFFIALFVFNRHERSCFWLGLCCFVFALRITCYEQFILQDIFPRVSENLMFRLGYLTFPLGEACLAGFIATRFPLPGDRKYYAAIIGVSAAYCLVTLFAPVSVCTALLVPFQAFTAVAALFVLAVVVRALAARRDGALALLAGFAVFLLFGAHDVLVANRLVQGAFLTHFGMLALTAAMGLVVVRHFTRAFNTVEHLSARVERVNESFARFVPNEFLHFMGKTSITELYPGESVRRDMCAMYIRLGYDPVVSDSVNKLALLELINTILGRVTPIIIEHGGFVDRFLNDGFTVLFPDDPCRAVRCALALEQNMAQHNTERGAEGQPDIRFSAGLERGPIVLGTIGSENRIERAVLSNVLTVARQLAVHAASREIGILVSADVAVPLGGPDPCACFLVPHGDLKIRGLDRPVSLFEARAPA
ncbi:MAG TPA: adenylate/guanylate cyclase domain-containing protein [Treponemataceae bacterium]|nr:adenylate/guanylate cyclase domain-containing protein [Treponemataceae bacterium]